MGVTGATCQATDIAGRGFLDGGLSFEQPIEVLLTRLSMRFKRTCRKFEQESEYAGCK